MVAPHPETTAQLSESSRVPWEAWQKGRASFNHDWLKNHYLLALDTFINVLDDLVENDALLNEYVSSLLPEWEERRAEIVGLIDEFALCMSPRTLFLTRPLVNCPPMDREYLGALVDTLWRNRRPVERIADDVRSAIGVVDAAYRELRQRVSLSSDTRSLSALRESRSTFGTFRYACLRLAQAVEVLPGTLEIL